MPEGRYIEGMASALKEINDYIRLNAPTDINLGNKAVNGLFRRESSIQWLKGG